MKKKRIGTFEIPEKIEKIKLFFSVGRYLERDLEKSKCDVIFLSY